MGISFSPERLAHIRRMRKARRLFRQQPLFAFELMRQEYPAYSIAQFPDDLRRRTKRKTKRGKSPLVRYGRYRKMQDLLALFRQTGNPDFLRSASQLRARMTRPYRVLVRIKGKAMEYSLSALIPIEKVERLTEQLKTCASEQEVDNLIRQLNEHADLR